MIYQTVNFNIFAKSFKEYGREDNFSSQGLEMLYDYIDDLSNDIGQDIELDVIALCCEYTEYTREEFLSYYRIDGIDCIDSLDQALIDGDLECVIDYDLDNDIILVISNY